MIFIGNANRINLFFLAIVICFLSACSTQTETTKEELPKTEEEEYIFDEIPDENVLEYKSEKRETVRHYFQIQLGAFSTNERAIHFSELSESVLQKDCFIKYDETKKLFLVRLAQIFSTKEEAKVLTDQIREKEKFKDAWIVKETEIKNE